jgi:hypothetical protein
MNWANARKKAFILAISILASAILFQFSSLTLADTSGGIPVQAPQIQWSQTYSAGAIRSMVQTSDGGYALSGTVFQMGNPQIFTSSIWLVKTNDSGIVQWTQSYANLGNAYSVIQTTDGGYALTGGGHLVKTDSSGKMLWNQNYGGQTIALVQTNDGGYAVAGYNTKYTGQMAFWLIKTDASGEVQWNQTYSTLGAGTAWSLIQSQDSGYVLAGEGSIVKTDSLGKLVWNLTVSGALYSVIQTKNGAFCVAGNTITPNGGNNDMWLAKIDSSGTLLWNQNYNLIDESSKGWWGAWSVVQTTDGGYALAGSLGLVKTDPSGNTQWSLTLNGTAYSVVQVNNGSYVLAGGDAGIFFADAWMMKTYSTEAASPSTSKNPSPTSSLNPSPSPTIPEFAPAIVLVLAAITGIIAVTIKRKRISFLKENIMQREAPRSFQFVFQ